jgi:hypothetical protein
MNRTQYIGGLEVGLKRARVAVRSNTQYYKLSVLREHMNSMLGCQVKQFDGHLNDLN